jgi:hypothetical protein
MVEPPRASVPSAIAPRASVAPGRPASRLPPPVQRRATARQRTAAGVPPSSVETMPPTEVWQDPFAQ